MNLRKIFNKPNDKQKNLINENLIEFEKLVEKLKDEYWE